MKYRNGIYLQCLLSYIYAFLLALCKKYHKEITQTQGKDGSSAPDGGVAVRFRMMSVPLVSVPLVSVPLCDGHSGQNQSFRRFRHQDMSVRVSQAEKDVGHVSNLFLKGEEFQHILPREDIPSL